MVTPPPVDNTPLAVACVVLALVLVVIFAIDEWFIEWTEDE